jgi:hypothetical protein
VLIDEACFGGGGVSRRTGFVPPRCRCAASTWPRGQGIRAMLINTGNANAGTGCRRPGPRPAAPARHWLGGWAFRLGRCCRSPLVSSWKRCPSTALKLAWILPLADAARPNWQRAAEAIMTTDTVAKAFGTQVMIDGARVSITGISKGAGMIRPNMATMLGFMATDACVSAGGDAATSHRAGRRLVQSRDGGRRHLDQRLVCGDCHQSRRSPTH